MQRYTKDKKVSLIIPAYNEADSIGQVLNDVPRDVVDEVIVVDGHSTDGTADIVKEFGVKLIEQEGRGYGDAVLTGIKHASGDILTFIDADGSYETKDIAKLVACIGQGYDIAYGSRYLPGSGSDDDTPVRFLGNKVFTFLLNVLHGVKLSDSLFLYIAARRDVFDKVKLTSKNFELCIEFPIKAHRAGLKYMELPSFEKKRVAGESKVNAFWHGLRILAVLIKLKFRS